MGIRGPRRNQCCRRLGAQNIHPYKAPITYFSHDLTIIDERLKRKYVRGPTQIPVQVEEPIHPIGADFFQPEPSTGVIRTTLASTDSMYSAGLVTSGSIANIGTIRGSAGPDGGDVYRVDADNQGLFKRNPFKLFPLDTGQMTVWLKPHDAGGSGSSNYILSIDENLVVRWESGSQELRLYPDLTNNPLDCIKVPWASSDWYGDNNWHKYIIGWDYQEQNWYLIIDGDNVGTRSGSGTIVHPDWDVFSNISIFTDINNQNNVYHDAAFLSFGEITDPSISNISNCADCCYQIDASSGSNSTYGQIKGVFGSANLRFWTSMGYEPDSLRVWRNTQELTNGVDFNETDPFEGQFNLTSVSYEGESLIAGYIPWGENCPDAKFVVSFASGSGSGTISPGPEPRIDGGINGFNKTYTLPFPYVSGKLRVLWQGMNQNQGDDSDWQEVDPYLGTFQFTDAPPAWSVLGAVFIPLTRYYEGSNSTLSGTVGSGNTDFETSYRFIPRDIEVMRNGQLLTPNDDFTLLSNKKFRLAEASISGEYITVAYGILFESGSNAVIAQTFDHTDDAADIAKEYRTVMFDTTSGNIGVTLPDAYQTITHTFNFKKIAAANQVDISGSGSQLIDGSATQTLTSDDESMTIESTGTEWIIK